MESFSESSDSSDSDQPGCESCFWFVYIFYQSEEITQIFSFSNKQPLMIINKTNNPILNLTPENITTFWDRVTTTHKGSPTPTKMSKIDGRQIQ